MTGDATPEHLADKLAEQRGRLAWISEEAGALVDAVAGRYTPGQGNYDVFLQGYDGGTIRQGRIGRRTVYIERPTLTIVVTPQPVILDRIGEQPDFRGRGVLARLTFVLPPSLVGTRTYRNRPIDSKAKAAYAAVITGVAGLPLPRPSEIPRLRLEGEALDLWKEEADAIELAQADGGKLAEIRDWASKHAGRVARIAGLLHLVRHMKHKEPWPPPSNPTPSRWRGTSAGTWSITISWPSTAWGWTPSSVWRSTSSNGFGASGSMRSRCGTAIRHTGASIALRTLSPPFASWRSATSSGGSPRLRRRGQGALRALGLKSIRIPTLRNHRNHDIPPVSKAKGVRSQITPARAAANPTRRVWPERRG